MYMYVSYSHTECTYLLDELACSQTPEVLSNHWTIVYLCTRKIIMSSGSPAPLRLIIDLVL